ncbi:alpha/beta fold hydrolase [Segniliparus rotundus]|uniref:alpha/beta fold hydrolase n=1 Tax=Segniliparus rotundus TaxID=286802 RepID=UPI001FDF9A19|nr:alpha/beta fold hydrolase [Segniliparus rotundus]
MFAAAVATASLAGCPRQSAPPAPPPAPPTQQVAALRWDLCRYDHSRPRPEITPGDAQCAVLKAPADPSQKNGPATVDIAVIRRTATDQQNKIGTLVYFPPAMDASGVDQIVNDPTLAGLEKSFDLVSFNPRGVAGSFSVSASSQKAQAFCDKSVLAEAEPFLRAPVVEPEQLEVARSKSVSVYNSCVQISKVDHFDAVTAAQDVELLRQSLGVDQISLYAHGYGTLAAQAYARLNPGHVRASVLDAPIPPKLTATDFASQLAGSLEGAYTRFAAWCAADQSCALGKQDPWEVYDSLVAKAGSDAGLVNPAFPDSRLDQPYLNWQIDQILAKADDAKLADYLKALTANQPFPEAPRDEAPADAPVQYPVVEFRLCQDLDLKLAPADVENTARSAAAAAPHFRSSPYANRLLALCLGFPSPAQSAPTGPAGSPVLVIGGADDVRSPAVWSQAVAAQLGEKATSVSVDDGTDQVRLISGGPAEQALANFLIALKAPPKDTVYPPN